MAWLAGATARSKLKLKEAVKAFDVQSPKRSKPMNGEQMKKGLMMAGFLAGWKMLKKDGTPLTPEEAFHE